jgi:uncharacterized protein (TIGR02145 family)
MESIDITLNILEQSLPSVPNTGFESAETGATGILQALGDYASQSWLITLVVVAGIAVVLVAIFLFFKRRRGAKSISRKFAVMSFTALLLSAFVLAGVVSATSNMTTDNNSLEITVTKSTVAVTGAASDTLTITTDNPYGYTVEAELDQLLPAGITATLDSATLSTTPIEVYVDDATPQHFNYNFDVTVEPSVTAGTYNFSVIFTITDNPPLTMQSMTPTDCAAMSIGDTQIRRDIRDNQFYEVRKMEDDKCWMINNLKLGSTTGTMLLTSEDTDLNSVTNPNITNNAGVLEFTLPQLVTAGSSDYDNPVTYGPVTGDSSGASGSTTSNSAIDSATFYGYLYNWSAATAGESRTTIAEGKGHNNAENSICPASWHLPTMIDDSLGTISDRTTQVYGNPYNDFSYLTAKMAGFSNNQDPTYLSNYWNYYAGWQHSGAFRGVFSGGIWGSFSGQGSYAYLWSRSAGYYRSFYAFNADFGSGYVEPSDELSRDDGFGVRCLLNN